ADATKNGLVEEESLDASASRADTRSEFFDIDFERLGSKSQELGAQRLPSEISHAAETARVCIAEVPAIVELEEDVSVLAVGLGGGLRSKVTGHTEVNEKSGLLGSVCRRGFAIGNGRRKAKQHELAETFDRLDATTREMLFECNGIVDEIGFAETDGENAAAGNCRGQAASNGFDFGKFGHGRRWLSLAHRPPVFWGEGRADRLQSG